jgi:hypothetical protein
MLKLIGFIVAAIPVVLFLKTIFFRPSGKYAQAFAEFKRHLDYVVWAILALIGCGLIYSIGKLLLS